MWISVKDRLPGLIDENEWTKKSDYVLVYNGDYIDVCQLINFKKTNANEWIGIRGTSNVTHWQPLPELPKE